MKIKVDFITNSSSSSFVVAWPFKVKTRNDILKYIQLEDIKIDIVFNDSRSQVARKIVKTKKIVELVTEQAGGGYLIGYHDYQKWEKDFLKRNNITHDELHKNKQWLSLLWSEQDELRDQVATKQACDFIDQNEGSYLYIYEYSDNDSEIYSELEHGGTFTHLPHIQISHH